MNDESHIPGEAVSGLPEEPVAVENEEAASLDLDEEVATDLQTVTLVDFQQAVFDICHVNLFCCFMICGLLLGLALFRRPNGT